MLLMWSGGARIALRAVVPLVAYSAWAVRGKDEHGGHEGARRDTEGASGSDVLDAAVVEVELLASPDDGVSGEAPEPEEEAEAVAEG
jgi:hypothetical protein